MESEKEKLLFSANPTPMIYFSREDKRIIDVNEAFKNRFRGSSEIVGRSLSEITQPVFTDIDSCCDDDKENSEYLSLNLGNGCNEIIELVANETILDGEPVYLGAAKELFPPLHTECGIRHPLYKSVFDKALDIILIADEQGHFVQVNETACQKLGYSREELLQMGVQDITHAPIRSYSNKKWDDFIRTGVDEGKYFLETKDGDVLYAEYRAVANIRPGMHLSILRDVTPERNLEMLEKRKDKAIENSLSGIVYMDSEFALTFANNTAIDLLGYENEQELIGQSIFQFSTNPNRIAEIKEIFDQNGEWEGQLTVRRKDGTDIVIRATVKALLGDREEPLIWQASFIDVTEQLETQKALANSETRFDRLLEAAPDGILVVDKEGIINHCNAQISNMLGYEKKELIGQPVEMLVPESRRQNHLRYRKEYNNNPHKRPMGSGIELSAIRKDGSEMPVDIMLGPLEEDGSTKIVAIVRDITKFRQYQLKLKEEKKFTHLLHKLTAVANQNYEFTDALQKSIDEICEFMDWPVGHVYLPSNDETDEFYPADLWHIEDEGKFQSFKKLTMKTRFAPGMGMIGEVMESGKPQWYLNCQEDPGFVRRLPDVDLNIRACFGLPILVEDEVAGILEFFSEQAMPSDALLVEKLMTISNQLGRVAERKRADDQLKKSETKFRTLFDTSLDAILILDEHRVFDCNESAERLLGIRCEDLCDYELNDFLTEDQLKNRDLKFKLMRRFKLAKEGEDQFFNWRFKRLDGTEFDAELSLIHMELEGRSLVHTIIRDVTERKKANQLVKRNMQLFSQLFQNSPVGVVMLDKRGRVEDTNTSFERVFGYQLSEIKGKELDKLITNADQRDEAHQISAKTFSGDSFQTESVRINKNGNEIPVLIGAVPVSFKDEIIAIFGMYVDISERKEAEEQLRQSLKEKEVLLKEIHHRVKNNLAVITGLLELQIENTEDDRARKKLKDSQSRIYSMALVHEQLYQTELFSSLELDEYIQDLSNSIRSTFIDQSTDIEIKLDVDPVELTINQAVPCGQLLNELITNSFKHAFPGRQKGVITITLKESSEEVRLQVSDDGTGIPDDFIDGNGNSLGMTLIQTLVHQLEGELEVDNAGGTTFIITFDKIGAD